MGEFRQARQFGSLGHAGASQHQWCTKAGRQITPTRPRGAHRLEADVGADDQKSRINIEWRLSRTTRLPAEHIRMTIDTARGLGKVFYDRYYRNRRTRVVTQAEMARRAALVVAFVRHVELPVRSILDAGCGLGLMRVPLLRGLPGAR